MKLAIATAWVKKSFLLLDKVFTLELGISGTDDYPVYAIKENGHVIWWASLGSNCDFIALNKKAVEQFKKIKQQIIDNK